MANIDIKEWQIGDNTYKFKDEAARQQLVTKQDAITQVSVTYTEDNGTPDASVDFQNGELAFALKNMKMKFSELTSAEKLAIKGDKGDQGDSAVWDENEPHEKLTDLAHVLGGSTVKPMSQKGVTDELTLINASYTTEQINSLENRWWINTTTWRTTTENYSARRIDIISFRGLLISITPQSGSSCKIAFLKDWPNAATKQTVTEWCDGESLRTITENLSMTVPQDAKYLYVCRLWNGSNILPASITISSTVKNALLANSSSISSLAAEVRNNSTISSEYLTLSSAQLSSLKTWWYINTSTNKWKSVTSNYAGKILNIAAYRGMELTVTPQTGVAMHIALLKNSGSSGATAQYSDDFPSLITTDSEWSDYIPSDASFLYINRIYNGVERLPQSLSILNVQSIKDAVSGLSFRPCVIYVDETNGDDDNIGTSSNPMRTVDAAMDAGAENLTIILKSSVTSSIDFTQWEGKKNHVTIRGWKDARRFVKVGTQLNGLIGFSNYEDVYTWTPTEDDTLPSGTSLWLWQHNIPDAATTIQRNERHPLQRGRECRRLSTCIKHASSLESLLASETPKWFSDGEVLYIKAVSGSDIETNPIIVPQTEAAITCPQSFGVTLVNIECWYGHILIDSTFKFEATDCAARYTVGAGAWRIDDSISAMLIRCEADSNTMANTEKGDGFNIHPASGSSIYAKGGTHTLIDCWAHDNNDDGYSDHGRSEGTIIGGLYEYNDQSGLAPAVGAHDTIYHAVCRNQDSGILYTGDPETGEGGMGGQVECFGCVCHDNENNYRVNGALGNSAEPNRMILNQCISRNASNAAFYVNVNSFILSRDCTDRGSTKLKETHGGASNAWITIDNGTIIT